MMLVLDEEKSRPPSREQLENLICQIETEINREISNRAPRVNIICLEIELSLYYQELIRRFPEAKE